MAFLAGLADSNKKDVAFVTVVAPKNAVLILMVKPLEQ
jgi:hypothetical protein